MRAHNIPCAVCVAPSEDEQVMHETCKGKSHPITGHQWPRGEVGV
jgi:hypothetical protein